MIAQTIASIERNMVAIVRTIIYTIFPSHVRGIRFRAAKKLSTKAMGIAKTVASNARKIVSASAERAMFKSSVFFSALFNITDLYS